MKNLHLLIMGSSEEEIRANAQTALDAAFRLYSYMGDRANCLASGEFEFDFREEEYIADIMDTYNKKD